MNYLEIIAMILFLAGFSFFSFKKKALSRGGIAIANVFGIAAYFLGGSGAFISLVFFFVVAESCTRYGRNKLGKSHEERNAANVIGNGLAAMIAIALRQPAAFYGALSAALGDTVSSEIGMLSKEEPRLITRPGIIVERGTDGGVTFIGFLCAALAGLGMGVVYYLVSGNISVIPVITLAGIVGTIVDSILGAELERKGIVGNTTVNFAASCVGAIIGYLLL